TFFCNETATTEIYTLSLHDALPISGKLEDAEQYYVQAIEIQKERGDRFSIFHLKNDLSNILLEQGNIQEAEKLALATFKEAEQINYIPAIDVLSSALSLIYEKKKDYP